MRIRKRPVPLPISSLSPLPLSGHHRHHHLFLAPQVQHISPPQSDLPNPDPRASKNTLNLAGDENNTNISTRGGCIFGVQSVTGFPPLSSSSSSDRQDVAVPLKKRRGSFEIETIMKEKETTGIKTKFKTNKKRIKGKNDKELQDENVKETKKSKRGSVIMEGSRCSRVNGRGWRCCQQTLVGYSLCEHHLGKGRLGSRASSSLPSQKGILAYGDDSTTVEKGKKIGTIKARSMSSLLGLANTAVEVAKSDR